MSLSLEPAAYLVLTAGRSIDNHNNSATGNAMIDQTEPDNSDSRADAFAIFALIMLAVATAVFWVSHQ